MTNGQPDENPGPSGLQQQIAGIALSMRIPPFWRDKPRLWFISFEAATNELKKSQSQLAQMVIAQLDKADIEQVSDILFNPPETDMYKTLKQRLITVYEESDSQQFQKLLTGMELGDQKPSQLLRKMRSLARDKLRDETLRLMWTNHLPAQVRAILSVSDTFQSKTSLEELATLADKMMESIPEMPVSAVASTKSAVSHQHVPANSLEEEVRKLAVEVAALKQQFRPNYQRHRSRDRSLDRRSPRAGSPVPYCFYHKRYGKQARRCTKPCSYNTSQSEN